MTHEFYSGTWSVWWSDPRGAPLQRVQTRIGNYECGDTLLREGEKILRKSGMLILG